MWRIMNLGRALVDAGRRGEAEQEFEAALKINPGFAEARRQLDSLREQPLDRLAKFATAHV